MYSNLLITKFRKNGLRDEIWVQIVTFKDHDFIDIRSFMPKTDGPGHIPMRKGICIDIELLPQLKEAILLAETVLKNMGKIL